MRKCKPLLSVWFLGLLQRIPNRTLGFITAFMSVFAPHGVYTSFLCIISTVSCPYYNTKTKNYPLFGASKDSESCSKTAQRGRFSPTSRPGLLGQPSDSLHPLPAELTSDFSRKSGFYTHSLPTYTSSSCGTELISAILLSLSLSLSLSLGIPFNLSLIMSTSSSTQGWRHC